MDKRDKTFPFKLPEDEPVNLKEEGFKPQENKLSGRPEIITIICGYFFIAWALSIISFIRLLTQIKNLGDIRLNFSSYSSLEGWVGLLISLLLFASILGYWNLKKWGVYLYTTVNVFLLVYISFKLNSYGLSIGSISSGIFWGSILPVFIIYVGFKYINGMR